MADLIEIGAVWESTDKNGNPMLSGKLGNARLVILKNTFKEKENQPDFRVYVTKSEQRTESGDASEQPATDDIPF